MLMERSLQEISDCADMYSFITGSMHVHLVFSSLVYLLSILPQDSFAPYTEEIGDTGINLELVPVAGGSYLMGSGEEAGGRADESPIHQVEVDDFWIGQYEITWEQYESFLFGRNSDEHLINERLSIDGVSSATSPYVDMSDGMGKSGYPAIGMTQYAAVMFCKWLSAKTGHFYRLPTEAEWEYACRAGSSGAYAFGDDPAGLAAYGVFEDNSNYAYARVGSKNPNDLGIYDMSGNVAEWTMDQYDATYYERSESDNPWNKPTQLYPRVVRGGSYKDKAVDCRCSARSSSKASWKRLDPQIPKSRWWHTNAFFVGFRVVRPRVQPSPGEIADYWLEPIEDFGQ
jgi:formylglycine-generating enzyme required for sulfatase activity